MYLLTDWPTRQIQYRSWANCFWRAHFGLAKPRGVQGKSPRIFLKFSFLKSLKMRPILKSSSYIWGTHLLILFSLHLFIIIGEVEPPPLTPPLATALKWVLPQSCCKGSQDHVQERSVTGFVEIYQDSDRNLAQD